MGGGNGGVGGDGAGGKLPALRLTQSGSVLASALAGEALLRSMLSTSDKVGQLRPPFNSKNSRPQTARQASEKSFSLLAHPTPPPLTARR